MTDNPKEERFLYALLSGFAFLSGWLFAILRNPAYDNGQTATPQDHTREESYRSQSEPTIVPQIAPSPIQANQPNNRRDDTPRWKKIAEWSIAGSTAGLLIMNIFLWHATKKTAETAVRQLEMIDRPWIKIGVRPWVDLNFESGNLSFGVMLKTENVGHSVSSAVYPRVKLIALNPLHDNIIDEPMNQAEKLCAETKRTFETVKGTPSVWGDSIFLGNYLEFPENLILSPSSVKSASFDSSSPQGPSMSLIPFLIGCVEYHYPSSDKPHRTQFVYGISHIDDPKVPEAGRTFFQIGKNIPADKVQFFEHDMFAD